MKIHFKGYTFLKFQFPFVRRIPSNLNETIDNTVFLPYLSHQRDSIVPYRTILYVTVFKKNTIVTLFVTFTVTFTVTFYPVTRTVTPIVILNCNRKYTVTPTVTVTIVTASYKIKYYRGRDNFGDT